MLKKLIATSTDEVAELRKKLFTVVSKGKFKDALKIIKNHPEHKLELLRGRGESTGRNILFWLGQHIASLPGKGPNSDLNQAISNPKSDISKLLQEMRCVSDVLGSAISGDAAAPRGVVYLGTLFANYPATLETCIQYLGGKFGTDAENDAITYPLRQAPVWAWLKEKFVPSGRPNVLVFGPGIFTDPSFSIERNGVGRIFESAKPFSPQLHELCSVVGSIQKIDVVDCSSRVVDLLSDSTHHAIPDYFHLSGIAGAELSQTLPEINTTLESVNWTPAYFSKFQPQTYDVIMGTYIFTYPIHQNKSPNMIETSQQIYRILCGALKPGGAFIIDANSFLASFEILNTDLEARWSYLMGLVKETMSTFPRGTFKMEQLFDSNPYGKEHYFSFTRVASVAAHRVG